MLLHHDTGQGRTQFISVGATSSGTNRRQLLRSIGHSDFRLLQGLPGLQIVLLSGDLFLPELLFPLVGVLGQCQALLRRLQFTALV